jgi:D-arabinitol 4-dehydrogenase
MGAGRRILHLGLGAFHRAHQAVFLQSLIDAGDDVWTLAGGNLRDDGAATLAALVAQGGAYTLETVSPAGERRYHHITALRHVVPYRRDLAELVHLGADPATRIVSFTVTEAGYYLDDNDRLDDSNADLAADLEAACAGRVGVTIYGALAAILRERRRTGAGKLTLLCCDNLRHNGDRSRAGLLEFLERAGDLALLDWVRRHTSSPNAMVDRITPRPTVAVRERVHAATGRDDAAAVMAEEFIQWVIEDDFCNERPAWQRVGVEMVPSVAPYEEAKIRILNASHSAIAWAGTLAGYRTIDEGARDPRIRGFAHDYVSDDVIVCLRPSPIDLERYRDSVLERFCNAALGDTNQRVAMDSFAKLPGFIVPTIRERLARGESIAAAAVLPALLLAFLEHWHRGELPFEHQDQAMDAAVAHAICAAADPVAAFCRERVLWGALAGDARLEAALREARTKATIRSGRALDVHSKIRKRPSRS